MKTKELLEYLKKIRDNINKRKKVNIYDNLKIVNETKDLNEELKNRFESYKIESKNFNKEVVLLSCFIYDKKDKKIIPLARPLENINARFNAIKKELGEILNNLEKNVISEKDAYISMTNSFVKHIIEMNIDIGSKRYPLNNNELFIKRLDLYTKIKFAGYIKKHIPDVYVKNTKDIKDFIKNIDLEDFNLENFLDYFKKEFDKNEDLNKYNKFYLFTIYPSHGFLNSYGTMNSVNDNVIIQMNKFAAENNFLNFMKDINYNKSYIFSDNKFDFFKQIQEFINFYENNKNYNNLFERIIRPFITNSFGTKICR